MLNVDRAGSPAGGLSGRATHGFLRHANHATRQEASRAPQPDRPPTVTESTRNTDSNRRQTRGMFDLTPMIAIIVLYIVQMIVVNLLMAGT